MIRTEWLDYLGLFPDDPFWIDGDGVLTRAAMRTAVIARTDDLGLATGERIALPVAPTRASTIEFLAVLVAGGTAVLLPRRETEDRRRELAHVATAEPGPPGQIWVRSGGTSGRGRWVVHVPATLMGAAEAQATRVAFGRGGIWDVSLPLDHVGGLSPVWRALVGGGALAAPGAGVSPTHRSLVPTQLHRALASGRLDDLRRLRCLLLGGAPLPREMRVRAIDAGLPLVVSYGMTETGAMIASSIPDDPLLCQPGYAGRPLWPGQLRIGDDGEVRVGGPSLAVGEVDDDGTMRPLGLDGEGLLATGDLGRRERDALYVLGRRDNLIISGGEKLAAEELEEALLTLPGVLEAVVVPITSTEYGQRPVAFLETEPSSEWPVDRVREALSDRIAQIGRAHV
jgi:o-succinylbenzoate---CoA ligase